MGLSPCGYSAPETTMSFNPNPLRPMRTSASPRLPWIALLGSTVFAQPAPQRAQPWPWAAIHSISAAMPANSLRSLLVSVMCPAIS